MTNISRRIFIQGALPFVGLLSSSVWAWGTNSLPENGRALSLRALQQRARECQSAGNCEPAVEHLAHLRRIDGYVIDRENRDVLLIGQVDPSWPALHLEDLVIALRDAWNLYLARIGDRLYVADPGVSIDPYPSVIQELQRIGAYLRRASDEQQISQALDVWHETCRGNPQRVRVEGIPFHRRASLLMLEVDYALKGLISGADSLPIGGFKSLMAMRMEKAKQDLEDGNTSSFTSMSRFWISPTRELTVMADEDAAFIDEFGLQVLTEDEHLNTRGEIVGTGTPDPIAVEWAAMASALYPEIAAVRPRFRELENFAWMIALSRTMRHREALSLARLDIRWLLNSFDVPETHVDETVPGHSNVATFRYSRAINGGTLVGALTLPSCGGVQLDVRLDGNTIAPDRNGRIERIKYVVQERKPDPDALYWDF